MTMDEDGGHNFSNHVIGNVHAGPSYIAGTRHVVHAYS